MRTCPKCSNPVDKDTKYCPYCDAPIDFTYNATVDANESVVAASNRISSLITRYKDAYTVASVTNGFGGLIKAIGIIIAALLVLIGFMMFSSGRGQEIQHLLLES
jgi:tetrahydromethanopterin S-methyltransferase subunit F